MTYPRLVAAGLVACVVSACATHPSTATSPVPAGPKALLHAQYYGGMLNRQIEAVFKVEENAYVMVGHLGGDGRFDVLYPEDARESGRVNGGKWFRTSESPAYYDAAPFLYSFATSRFRTAGAQLDSYDGRGYGFIFMIASARPLDFDRISTVGLWNDLDLENYGQSIDPRPQIRHLAEALAHGQPYTLKFARSVSTYSNATYADYQYDCALLQELGYASFVTPYSYWFGLFSPFTMMGYNSYGGFNDYGGFGGCGSSRYAYAPFPTYVTYTTASAPIPTPTGSRFFRPPHRPLGTAGSAFTFSNPDRPTRRNSPQNPAAAPRDWLGLRTHPSPFGGSFDAGRSHASPDRAGRSSNASTTRVAPVERAHPIERTEAPRPMTTTTAKPVVEKSKP
ncbi:MAG TPA: hypothetical protein VJ867_17910 [Gemmatimonadaceae bacterium]|nr:hypothetical protein [Gemmatimonadaceae bacterium]